MKRNEFINILRDNNFRCRSYPAHEIYVKIWSNIEIKVVIDRDFKHAISVEYTCAFINMFVRNIEDLDLNIILDRKYILDHFRVKIRNLVAGEMIKNINEQLADLK